MIFRRTFLRQFFVSKNSFEVRSPKLFNVTRGWSPPSRGNSSNQKPIAFNRTVRNRRVSFVDGKVLHQTETNERSLKLPVAIQLSLIWSGLRYHRPAAKNVSDSITSPQTDAGGNFVTKNHSIFGRNNETWSSIHLRPSIGQDSWRNFGELLRLDKFYFPMHRICVFFFL